MKEEIKIVNNHIAEHYNWGNNCDGWHLVKTDGLSVIREEMPPGASEAMHYHENSRQFFYVLSGTASMEIEGKIYKLNASEGIEIPPLVPHRMYNGSNEAIEFLVISQPKSHGDRVTSDN